MLDLAIVIVSYNTCGVLRDCLSSVARSANPPQTKVIVVDNGSSDQSVQMVRDEFPWVELIVSATNGGYAYGNNLGLATLGLGKSESPQTRYVLLLNPDTVLPPEALARTVSFMDSHPDVGVLGPKLVRSDGSLDKACRRSFPTPAVSFYQLSGLGRAFPNSPRFARYNLTYLDPDVQSDVDSVVGAFMLVRSTALQQAGLLDEAFFMYGEDIDLCFRIKRHGWRVVYYPEVTVLHLKGASSRKASRKATIAFYDAMKIFHDKHYRDTTPGPVNLLIDVGVAALKGKALLVDRLRPEAARHVASAKV